MNVVREQLADYAHQAWSGWMAYMLPKCALNDDGSMTIPSGYVAALNRQITTAYTDLSEAEKDSDRAEAEKMLAIVGHRAHICGVVSHAGPNGEAVACAFIAPHPGPHSWATLPTFATGNAETVGDVEAIARRAAQIALGIMASALHADAR